MKMLVSLRALKGKLVAPHCAEDRCTGAIVFCQCVVPSNKYYQILEGPAWAVSKPIYASGCPSRRDLEDARIFERLGYRLETTKSAHLHRSKFKMLVEH